jgi:16S rRNA (adenine1518-N6/adenine1519-N6)-dimethyltransferase
MIAPQVKRLIVIELDDRLIAPLRGEFAAQPIVEVVHADALTYPYDSLPGRWKVVANLPYYISTAIIQRLIACRPTFTSLTLMLQKEVAERIAAAPGGKEYGFLSVLVQYHSIPRLEFLVPPTAFTPRPKVSSAVVTLQVRAQPAVPVADERQFLQVVKAAFGQRRKTLRNSLAPLGLTRNALDAVQQTTGIDLGRRAETLSLGDFASLAEAVRRQTLQPRQHK